jgi:plastocyanin domain-containing protein
LPTADGRQTISITAKGGYFPKEITAEANKETLLTVSTKNTYDCSLALVIPKLNYTKNLKPQDQTTVSIPPQKAGTEIDGTCSMGMYKFTIKFV